MNRNTIKLTGLLIGLLLIVSGSAWAQTPKVWITAGAKGGIGGNYLSEPDDATWYSGPFEDGAGGIGGGGGIFGDVRFLNQHLGLEVDLLIDANKTWCSFNDADFILKYANLRIPVLVKGSVNHGNTRLGLGIGPEFRVGLNADTDIEAPDFWPQSNVDALKEQFTAKKRNDVALAWELAFGFAVKRVEITLDVRFSYNLTLPKEYLDRLNYNSDSETSDGVEAGHTVDARILLGVGYVFTAGE